MQWHRWSRALEDSRRSVATWCHRWPWVARGVRRDVVSCLRCLCQGAHSGLLSLSSPSVGRRDLRSSSSGKASVGPSAFQSLRWRQPSATMSLAALKAAGCEDGGCISRFKMKAFRSIRKTADRPTISGQLQESNRGGSLNDVPCLARPDEFWRRDAQRRIALAPSSER